MSKDRQHNQSAGAREPAGATSAPSVGKQTRVGQQDAKAGSGPYKGGSVFSPGQDKDKPEGSGQLPEGLRSKFEGSLGVDLSGVRIHTDAAAGAAASGVGARAYAEGQNIYFGDKQYDPSSGDGEHLLAHEVAHTVQQSAGGGSRVQRKSAMTETGDRFEVEADRAADAMVGARSFSIGEQSAPQIARQSSGERVFLDALAVLGAFPSEGMVATQTARVKNEFPPKAHKHIYYPLKNFMLTRLGHMETYRYFQDNVNILFNEGWIGPDCRRKALGRGEDNASVGTLVAEGKAPAKVALKHAVARKKEADAMDLAPQRANAKALMRALEKVAQSPFKSTAQFEGEYVRLQDVGKATTVAPLRSYVKLVLEKFADAVEQNQARVFPRSLLVGLVGLIGKNGSDDVYARAKALIAGKAKGTTKELRDPSKAEAGLDKRELAIKLLEKAKDIPKVGPAFEFLANALKIAKDTDPGDIVGDIAGMGGAIFNAVKSIVELAGGDEKLGLQAAEQLSTVSKYLGYVGSAASAGKHLGQVFSATNPRARTEAIVALLGDVPGPIGDGLKVSFTVLRWLGEETNKIRVASKDIALKEFFFGNAPIPPVNVPALLKAKVRMIREMPSDAASARRTFGYLAPNPADPTGSCQELFPGLDARREWARVARPLHDKYAAGAFTIDGGMDWKSRPGNRTIDEYRVEAVNEMKRAAANFIERKVRELVKQTGATE